MSNMVTVRRSVWISLLVNGAILALACLGLCYACGVLSRRAEVAREEGRAEGEQYANRTWVTTVLADELEASNCCDCYTMALQYAGVSDDAYEMGWEQAWERCEGWFSLPNCEARARECEERERDCEARAIDREEHDNDVQR